MFIILLDIKNVNLEEIVMNTVGLICALGTGKGDLVSILADLNMSVVAFVIYLLLTITSGQAVIYIAALALENITKVIRGRENLESDGKFTANFFIIPSCIFAAVFAVFMTANDLLLHSYHGLELLEQQFHQ